MKGLYGVLEHQGRRDGMEDATSVLLTDDYCLFGVYDGHGGETCSAFLRDKLLARVSASLQKGETPKRALEKAFLSIDKDYCDFALSMDLDDGSTATVLLLKDGEYHLAAAGDSRAVLVLSDGTVQPLSADHKPDRRDERHRVTQAGGQVEYDHDNDTYRVFSEEVGGLAVTRALGDAHFKPYVTALPEISSGKVVVGDVGYVVMASDGLWDDVHNEEAGEVMMEMRARAEASGDLQSASGAHLQEAVKELVFIAYSRGSEDNITVMAVDLQRYSETAQETKRAAAKLADGGKQQQQQQQQAHMHHGGVKRTIQGLDEFGHLSELLLWKYPLRTFLWLAVGTLTFFLTFGAGYSLLTLTSYLLMMQIVITTFVVQMTPMLKRLRLVRENFDSTVFVLQGSLLSDEVVQRAADVALRTTTSLFSKWNTVVREGSAARILVSLRFVSYLFSPLPLDVVLFILFIALFSLPATYHHNQPYMDRQYQAVLAGYHKLTRKLFSSSS